jgi:hypothetical protein
MNSLREITQVIARLKLEKIEIIDEEPTLGDQDNISKLYFGIKSNSISTDQEAAKLIYNSPQVDTRFTTLKNRLKIRLLNTLFFLDIKAPAQSEMAENMYKTYRYTFWSKTLLLIGARESSKKMAQKGLLFAERSALTAEIVQLLTDLRNLAGGSGNTTEYRDLNEQLKKHTHNLLAELQARDFNDQIRMMYAKTTAENPEAISVVDKFVSNLDSIQPEPDSFYYKLFYYRVKIYALQVKQMYDEMIDVCDAGEQLFLSSPILSSNIRLGEFVVYKLYGYLLLKKFSEGQREAKRAIELFPAGGNTWFSFMEYYFLLAMHTQHFIDANKIYQEVITNPRFGFQLEQMKEKWRIYEAYLYFALKTTDLLSNEDRQKFDLRKFVKDVPTYKKDKRGFNVSILVLQIIVLLDQNNFDGIISRMDSLRTYRQRYLGSGANKQSALFFKMLMVMEKSFFTYEETKTKAQKYYDKMLEIGSNSDETQEGLQILPFEWLWSRILDMLKEKERTGIIR